MLPAAGALIELLGSEAAATANVQRASALLAQDVPALVAELSRCGACHSRPSSSQGTVTDVYESEW